MNALELQIATEVRRDGPLSFARFMQLALYCPDYGYYERKEHSPGRRGDFYTGVSVGSLLGRLLGFLFDSWAASGGGGEFQVAEGGAHDGRLAGDVLDWAERMRPAWATRLQYTIVEPSARRRRWQAAGLERHAGRIRWIEDWSRAPAGGFSGVVFCNELLDAFPVHRLSWDAGARGWREWGVDLGDDGAFRWVRLPWLAVDSRYLPEVAPGLAAVLPEGFSVEVSPEAVDWWRGAARALQAGRLMALDYGLEAEDWLVPARASGTLRAYARHRQVEDVLAGAGERDITAHVNWTHLRRAGEEEGLVTEDFGEQGRFLTRLGERAWRPDAGFGDWTPELTRQFQTLAHPGHLGMKFQVLVQRR